MESVGVRDTIIPDGRFRILCQSVSSKPPRYIVSRNIVPLLYWLDCGLDMAERERAHGIAG